MRRFFAAAPVKNVEQRPDAKLVLTLARPEAAVAPVANRPAAKAAWSEFVQENDGWTDVFPLFSVGSDAVDLDAIAGGSAGWGTLLAFVNGAAPEDVIEWTPAFAEGEESPALTSGTDCPALALRIKGWVSGTFSVSATVNGKPAGTLTFSANVGA